MGTFTCPRCKKDLWKSASMLGIDEVIILHRQAHYRDDREVLIEALNRLLAEGNVPESPAKQAARDVLSSIWT